MILADTSIVIDFFHSADPTMRRIVVDEPVAICGITRSEVLHGARSSQDRAQIVAGLDLFKQISIVDSDWDEVGDLLASLRSAGIAVPMADAVIACVAIPWPGLVDPRCPVWFDSASSAEAAVVRSLRRFER
jgi:predicted nucleic acid-binding protein